MSSGSTTLSPKHAGETAASEVLHELPTLDHVPDTETEYYDARTTLPLEPDDVLKFIELDRLGAGVPVEIKTAMVVYGEDGRIGRFNIRLGQHRQLLWSSGVYLFAVCTPDPSRDVLGMVVVPAEVVDTLVPSWFDLEERETYGQFSWTRVLDREAIL